jgi:3-hydroxyisobutyrate dehydrogenase-like beta-hydroxyacid dehydrogenase
MQRIGFCGLGEMGSRMVSVLLDAEFPVTVWNRSPEKAHDLLNLSAVWAETPSALAADVDIVITMVRDDAAEETVWFDPEQGILASAKPGLIGITCSTQSHGMSLAWGKRCVAAGIKALEAPVVGTLPHAASGKLAFLVGGEAETLRAVRPMLETMAGGIHHLGKIGQGSRLKLLVNTFFGVQVAALAELSAAFKDDARLLETFQALPTCSPVAQLSLQAITAGKHEPLFPIDLVCKDLHYMAELLGDDGDREVLSASRRQFEAAVEKGLGARNITGVAEMFQKEIASV